MISVGVSIGAEEKPLNQYQKNWRWWVLGTLFLATFLNYFDRQTLGAAMSPISKEFNLNSIQVGNLLSAFLLTYAIAHLFIGVLLDRLRNIRWFFPIMVVGWSITTIIAGLAQNYQQLIWMRYLLGIWEAVNFPICLMIIARIFPVSERSLAAGVFASGAFLATLIAPKVVIYFSNAYTWRYSFIFAGLLGILWLIPWFSIYKNSIAINTGTQHSADQKLKISDLLTILRNPSFWGVALIGIGIIPSLYFATQWLPYYLEKGIGLSYDNTLGNSLMVIYLMQDAGLWVGGGLVLWLARKQYPILRARKMVIIAGYLLMMSILFLNVHPGTVGAILILCFFTFGIGTFLGNQHAFKQDIDPKQVATVSAWVGFIEMMFTHFVIREIGVISGENADFTWVFLLLAVLSSLALLVVFVLLRPKWLTIK